MKKTVLFFCLQLVCAVGFGQVNYYKFSGGIGLGATLAYADLDETTVRYAGYGELNVNFTPFITAGFEFQSGQLKGGNILTNAHHREFRNNYKSISVNVKGALGEIVDYSESKIWNTLKGAYLGVGLGAIRNDVDVVRYKPNTAADYPPLGYRFPGDEKSTDFFVPINLGLNFFINDGDGYQRYTLNFNYQTALTFGEGLDGYNDPVGVFKNDAADLYVFFSAGVKYNFGPRRSTKRRF